jgi:hypothetical protein
VFDTLFRARWLAPALLLALCGCGAQRTETRFAARQAEVDPPELWRVTASNATGGPVGAVLVCADRTVTEGFARADAEISGRQCLPLKDRVERAGLFAVRCELNGRRFGLTVTRTGDPARDFTVAFALRSIDGGSPAAVRQVRRFEKLGSCPRGWAIGDQAKLDGRRGVNALVGTWAGE